MLFDMTRNEYINKVQELEKQLSEISSEYVNSNKIYNEGDYLRITFKVPYRGNKLITCICQIVNIYPQITRTFLDNKSWPKGELQYFARYIYKDKDNNIYTGDVCYLGPLSHYNHICGYKDIDWNTVNIEVIKKSDI